MNERGSGSSYRATPALKRSRSQLAAFMRRRRQHLELPAAHVARELGISSRTYRDWESGARSVQVEYLPQIAVVLCTSTHDLVTALALISTYQHATNDAVVA